MTTNIENEFDPLEIYYTHEGNGRSSPHLKGKKKIQCKRDGVGCGIIVIKILYKPLTPSWLYKLVREMVPKAAGTLF